MYFVLVISGSDVYIGTTCGVSIMLNILNDDEVRKEISIFKDYDVKSCKGFIRDVRLNSILNREALTKGEVFLKVYNIVSSFPEKYSAELNVLKKFLSKRKFNNVVIDLFSTDTGIGWFCTMIIARCIENGVLGNNVKLDSIFRISGFGRGLKHVNEALLSLADKFVRKLLYWRGRGYEVYANIVGGLKIETIYTTLMAFLAGAKVLYIPDLEGDIIEITPIPITLKRELIDIVKNYKEKNFEELNGVEKELLNLGILYIDDNNIVKVREWIRKLAETL